MWAERYILVMEEEQKLVMEEEQKLDAGRDAETEVAIEDE
jgi:hypothetical protein